MKKKIYVTPKIDVMVVQQQCVLCTSTQKVEIKDEYTDSEQLSNWRGWDKIWDEECW